MYATLIPTLEVVASMGMAGALMAVVCRFLRLRHSDTNRVGPVGGLLIWLSVLVSLVVWYAAGTSFVISAEFPPVVFGLLSIVLVGAVDDLHPLKWYLKLALQILAVIPVAVLAIEKLTILPGFSDYLIGTVVVMWMLLVMNGLNLMDGINGLAGAWCLLVLAVFAFVGMAFGPAVGVSFDIAALLFTVLLPLSVFVFHNRFPAIFELGDAGSLSLGYLLATMSVLLVSATPGIATASAVSIVLLLPVLEVSFTILRRLRAGSSPFRPDLDHTHHKLVRFFDGDERRASRILIYVGMGSVPIAVIAMFSSPVLAILLVVCVGAILLRFHIAVASLSGRRLLRIRLLRLPVSLKRAGALWKMANNRS